MSAKRSESGRGSPAKRKRIDSVSEDGDGQGQGQGAFQQTRTAEAPKLGVKEPDEDKSPLNATKLHKRLFEKFAQSIIFVDTAVNLPKKVWFLRKDVDVPLLDNGYDICYNKMHPNYDEEYRRKWEEAGGENGKHEELKIMKSVLEEMVKYFEWDQTEFWSMSEEDEDRCFARIAEHLKEKPVLAALYNIGKIHLAFAKNLSNSAGRTAMLSFFTLAARIAFGENSQDIAPVYLVGSSRDQSEKLPVEVISSVRQSASLPYELRPYENVAVQSQCASSDQDDQVSVASSYGKSELYTDALAGCGQKPNWPRFLFMTKIEKTSLSLAECCRSQILRQMLAAVMHQNFVYGLLINSQKAVMYKMVHDFETKKIHVSHTEYGFQSNLGTGFDSRVLKTLFIDIVATLDYGQSNIKEISHGF